jgi:hypothetical protein
MSGVSSQSEGGGEYERMGGAAASEAAGGTEAAS